MSSAAEYVVLTLVISGFSLVLVGMVVGYLQLRQIHSAVNSNMAAAMNKISELHGVISSMKETIRVEREE